MAPHDTNTPKEARRHAVPLIGITILLVLVAIGFVVWIFSVTEGPDEPEAIEQVEPAN